MKYIGAHVSAAGGVFNAPLNAQKIGANAMALFTKNQKQWQSSPLDDATIASFKQNLETVEIKPEHVLVHDSYLINIGNPFPDKREKSVNALLDEAQRVEQLGLKLLNFHPGAHLGELSDEECLDVIADGMNTILMKTTTAVLVIEVTSGQGSNVGYRFEHIKRIMDQVEQKKRVGVCIDTCHIFGAGYDVRTEDAYKQTMDSFEEIIGFDKLLGVHLNDSKVELGSRKDRHHSLGEGLLGLDPFRFIMNDKRFDNIPLILETIDDTKWKQEIELLRGLIK